MITARIADLSAYHPERVVTNEALEQRLNAQGEVVAPGSIARLFGSVERRFAAPEEQVSDLAAKAARPIVERAGAENIGFLIFAAACADMIEPATCNMVQHKLGLRCPGMDVKNACNSFTSGLLTASSLISAGVCNNVLVVNGEKLSDAIRFDGITEMQLRNHLAAYSFGDAGAAALVSASPDGSGFQLQRFLTLGEHWQLCTIPGGGSMHPHDADKTYFEGQTAALKDVLGMATVEFFHACLQELGWQADEVQHLFTHQVSTETCRLISRATGMAPGCNEEVFSKYGNTAAASIMLALCERYERGEIRRGDKVAMLGLAAGVSVSVQLLVW